MIPTSTQWDSLCQRPGLDVTVVVRMYYGNESAYKSFANRDLTIGTEKFLGVIRGVPTVIQQLDMKEHTHSISSLKIEINNLEYQPGARWSDLVEDTSLGAGTDIGFYNRKIDIRLYLDGITTFANCFPLLSNGIVRDIKHSRKNTTIDIEDRTELINQDIGTYIADTDASIGAGLPGGSKGGIKPIIYGDHRFYYGNVDDAINTTALLDNNLIPCLHIGVSDTGKHEYLVSEHKLDSLATGDECNIWAYDSTLKRFVRVVSFTIEQNTSSGCIISRTANPTYHDYYYGDKSVSNENNTAPGDWVTDTYGNDRDLSTDTDSIIAAVDAIATKAEIELDFSGYESSTGDTAISTVRVYSEIYWTAGSGLAAANVDFLVNSTSLTAGTAESTLDIRDCSIESADAAGVNLDVLIEHSRDTDGANTDTTAHVYEVWKRITYIKDGLLPIFAAPRGLEYDTWINDRAIGDGYTEEHGDHDANANAAASPPVDEDLIENFAGVIESVLRDYLSVATANIDEDSFNIASNDIGINYYKCSTSITERINSLELIFSLCKTSRLWLWWQPDGTIKIKAMPLITASSDRVIDARDVTNLIFDRTPITDIKTAVDVRYNYSQGKYTSSTGISEDTDQQSKYNLTQAQSILIFGTKYINDNTGANNRRGYLLEYFKQPHNIAIGELDKLHLDLDLGDIIEFSNMPYKVHGETITANATRNSQTIYKYWWIFHIERSDKLKFKAIQLHNLV